MGSGTTGPGQNRRRGGTKALICRCSSGSSTGGSCGGPLADDQLRLGLLPGGDVGEGHCKERLLVERFRPRRRLVDGAGEQHLALRAAAAGPHVSAAKVVTQVPTEFEFRDLVRGQLRL